METKQSMRRAERANDHNVIGSGPMIAGVLLAAAFVANAAWLVFAVGAFAAALSLVPDSRVWMPAHRRTPMRLRIGRTTAQRHRVAQACAGAALLIASWDIVAGVRWIGWTVVVMVVWLVCIHTASGFFAGPFAYRGVVAARALGGGR